MKAQAILKSMLRSVFPLESEVETLRAEMEILERPTEEIIGQCSVSAKSGSRFARYVNENVSDRLQALFITVENKLTQCAEWETSELQHVSTDEVREWNNHTDQDIELGTTRGDGTMFATFSLQGLD